MNLDFKKAKALLVEYAPGNNEEYEKITTWRELHQAASFELGQASEAERLLSGVVSASARQIEDNEI